MFQTIQVRIFIGTRYRHTVTTFILYIFIKQLYCLSFYLSFEFIGIYTASGVAFDLMEALTLLGS